MIQETKPEFQTDLSALSRIYIKTQTGISVPLSLVTKLVPGVPLTSGTKTMPNGARESQKLRPLRLSSCSTVRVRKRGWLRPST